MRFASIDRFAASGAARGATRAQRSCLFRGAHDVGGGRDPVLRGPGQLFFGRAAATRSPALLCRSTSAAPMLTRIGLRRRRALGDRHADTGRGKCVDRRQCPDRRIPSRGDGFAEAATTDVRQRSQRRAFPMKLAPSKIDYLRTFVMRTEGELVSLVTSNRRPAEASA